MGRIAQHSAALKAVWYTASAMGYRPFPPKYEGFLPIPRAKLNKHRSLGLQWFVLRLPRAPKSLVNMSEQMDLALVNLHDLNSKDRLTDLSKAIEPIDFITDVTE